MPSLVDVNGLKFRYGRQESDPWTLDDLSLSIEESSTVGIVGESGSGKSTLIRILCGLLRHQEGDVEFDGRNIQDWIGDDPRDFRRLNQIVFQSPRRSLDPRMRIRRSLSQPVRAVERRAPSETELVEWLRRVGLGADILDRYPHQLSGGQLQRIGVARALSVGPRILYADEPTSALDVSVQAQVLNLLMDLRTELGVTLVMVTHDLAVVSRLCENVIVMQSGRIVEAGRMTDVLSSPREAYTARLVEAARSVSLVAELDR